MWLSLAGEIRPLRKRCILSNIANHVTVIHRRDQFRSEKILSDQLIEKSKTGNVTIEWDHVLEEVLGDNMGVTGVRIKHTQSEQTKDIDAKGCFIAIGHKPNTDLFIDQLAILKTVILWSKVA